MLLLVFKQPGANVIDTVDSIKAALPGCTRHRRRACRSTPSSTARRPSAPRSTTSSSRLLITIGLVVMVIFLFLRNIRATLIPARRCRWRCSARPRVMYLLGFSLDNLSLMALTIAVGFVVDDAIVMLENIYRHLEAGTTPLQAALKGAREIGFTIVSISISLIAVFIPLLLMGGIVGRLFREFAITVTAAIVVSVIVSLTLTPMMCSRFLVREPDRTMAASTAPSNGASMRCSTAIAAASTWCCGISS